jgi:germination protein M
MNASPRPPRLRLWLGLGLGAVFLASTLWFAFSRVTRWFTAPGTDTPARGSLDSSGARKIHATLFYVSDDGSELVPASLEVAYAATPGEQARRIAEAQVQAPLPSAGLVSAIPTGTTVRALYLTPHGEAYIDLSREIMAGHTGGSLDEVLAVFAIVDAVTVNLPDVSAVQILVDGKQVDTLAGHVDLRHPLKRSLKWVRKGQ